MNERLNAGMAAALIVFSLALWFWFIPAFAGTGEQTIMPRIAAALIGGLSLLMLVVSTLRLMVAARRPGGSVPADDPFLELDRQGEPLALYLVVAIWGTVLLFPGYFGLHLGSGIAVAATFLVLGVRRPVTLVLWTVAPIVVLHMVFEQVFSLRLPRGALVSLML